MIKISKKELKETFPNRVFALPYESVDLDFFFSTRLFTESVYGKDSDIYLFDTFALSIGYRPTGVTLNNLTICELRNLINREIEKINKEKQSRYSSCNELIDAIIKVLIRHGYIK